MCKLKFHILAFLCFWGTICSILCAAPFVSFAPSADALCTANPFITLSQDFTDDGYFGDSHRFMYEYSADGLSWSRFPYSHTGVTYGYTQRPTNLQEGWYRVLVAREDELEMPERWLVSEPVYMEKIEGGCTPFKHPWPDEVSDDVCPRGTILFREDFGGNDPSDPVTSQERLTTMSSRYIQSFDVISRVNSGKFVVAKHGWQNNLNLSTTESMFSQWFIQDDHTYPNDYSRGYLLEVDGIGGNDAFYSTTFPVCHEMDLSFSAYVANVLEPGHPFTKPKVRFLIQDELTNDTIWEQSSGAIDPAPADFRQYGIQMTMSAPWHLVGATFHVPEGVSSIRLSIFNDENSSSGNDFAMDDIEIRLCKPEVSIHSGHEICMDSSYVFEATVTADGGFKAPYNYLWQYAPDSLPFNSDEWTNVTLGADLSFDSVKLSDEGWYRLCVTSDGVDVETERYCRAMSEPFHLIVHDCTPCPELQTLTVDTTVCDTLMPFRWRDSLYTEPGSSSVLYLDRRGCDSVLVTYALHTIHCCPEMRTLAIDTTVCDTLMPFLWRDTLFTEPGSFSVLHRDKRDCDSLLCVYTLHTEVCCPPLKSAEMDTTVCDTLMPFTWRGLVFSAPGEQTTMERDARGCEILQTTWRLSTELCCPDLQYAPVDTVVCDSLMPFTWHGLLFGDPSVLEVMEYSPRGCDSILHIYTLDTVHCERLYTIIVNKYNWQLLCDNVELHRLFPARTPTAFQWYKNDEPVWGAVVDDYSEQNELHGKFQLRVTIDGEQTIWSNIIELFDSIEEIPVNVRIFNSRGEQVSESQVSHGIYLYRYEQGPRVWTEKRFIP